MRAAETETAAPVVAWGSAARVPGFVLDGLAGDMRRGAAAFDVTLTVPSVQEQDNGGRRQAGRGHRRATGPVRRHRRGHGRGGAAACGMKD